MAEKKTETKTVKKKKKVEEPELVCECCGEVEPKKPGLFVKLLFNFDLEYIFLLIPAFVNLETATLNQLLFSFYSAGALVLVGKEVINGLRYAIAQRRNY